MIVSLCAIRFIYLFFFFKQKTAYEMRISDWSSDVCSSDLLGQAVGLVQEAPFRLQHVDRLAVALDVLLHLGQLGFERQHPVLRVVQADPRRDGDGEREDSAEAHHAASPQAGAALRSAPRRRAERARGLAAISAWPGVRSEEHTSGLTSPTRN